MGIFPVITPTQITAGISTGADAAGMAGPASCREAGDDAVAATADGSDAGFGGGGGVDGFGGEDAPAEVLPKYLIEEMTKKGVTEEMAVEAVQALRSSILAAAKEVVDTRDTMVREAIDAFKGTKFGLLAYQWVHDRGYMVIPLFPHGVGGDDKRRAMTQKIQEKFLRKKADGRFEVTTAVKRQYNRIESQQRWMVDLNKEQQQKKVGVEFMDGAKEAAQTMGFVLQALEYGNHDVVDVEKLTLLISAAAQPCQPLHKDQHGRDVQSRMEGGQGSGTRARKEPPSYSAVCAFDDPIYLYVIEGSHKDFLKDDFDWRKADELVVPPGYGVVFHSCLVHAGGSYAIVNGRLHVYYRCQHGTLTANGKFFRVKQSGVPPRAKAAS